MRKDLILSLFLFGILFLMIPIKVNASNEACKNTFQIITHYDYTQYSLCYNLENPAGATNDLLEYQHGTWGAWATKISTDNHTTQFAFRFQSFGYEIYNPIPNNDYVLTMKFLMVSEESAKTFKNILSSNDLYTTTRDFYHFDVEQHENYVYFSLVFKLKIYPTEDFYFDFINGEGISQIWVNNNVSRVYLATITPLSDLYEKVSTLEEQYKRDMSAIEEGMNNMQEKQDETNNKLDEINNADISDSDKEMPNDSSYQDYAGSQDELLDKAKDIDLNVLDVGLDTKSSSWVWDTLTRLIQSNSVVFGLFIGILSIGIIKLILGR